MDLIKTDSIRMHEIPEMCVVEEDDSTTPERRLWRAVLGTVFKDIISAKDPSLIARYTWTDTFEMVCLLSGVEVSLAREKAIWLAARNRRKNEKTQTLARKRGVSGFKNKRNHQSGENQRHV